MGSHRPVGWRQGGRFRSALDLARAMGLLAACAVPGFLSGPLVDEIRADFPLSDAALGLSFSAFWGVAALASAPAAMAVRRLGPTASLRFAGLIAAAASLAIALFVHSTAALILILAVGGVAVAFAAPGVAVLLVRAIPAGRRGLAFALSQSSAGAGLLIVGIAVPVLGEPLGWRPVFAAAALLAAAVALLAPHVPEPAAAAPPGHAVAEERPDGAAEPVSGLRSLALVMIGITLGNSAIGCIQAFLVAAAPSAGASPIAASVVLAVGAALTILLRIALGVRADRRGIDPLPTVAALTATGALGFVFIATGLSSLYLAGGLVVLVVGWAWIGLFAHAVVNRYPHVVEASTSVMQTGFFAGGVVGPLCFGVLVEWTSFTVGWAVAGLAMLTCAGAAGAAIRVLPAHRGAATAAAAPGQRPH